MQGLKDLCVTINSNWVFFDTYLTVLDPLRNVEVNGVFEVHLPLAKRHDLASWSSAPFKMINNSGQPLDGPNKGDPQYA